MTSLLDERPFYTYLREERQFSFLLASFLMQRGASLAEFLRLVSFRTSESFPIDDGTLDQAEVYIEFALLRDYWRQLREGGDGLAAANDRRRVFIMRLLATVPSLHHLNDELPTQSVPEFNVYFMGESGRRIVSDIASPGLWSVPYLADRFETQPDIFLDLCKLKWSFNIKPDLVIRVPGAPALCIEAKLESGEGLYPTGKDAEVFDRMVKGARRVGQFELQKFMFQTLLDEPCVPLVIQRQAGRNGNVLTWEEVFAAVHRPDGSIPFVGRLLQENWALHRGYPAPPSPTASG